MSQKEWTIIAVLAVVVVIVFCLLGILLLGTLTIPRTQVVIAETTATPQFISDNQSNTFIPTETPKPTSPPTFTRILPTLTPTVRPTPAFVAQTQKLGPIRETSRDEEYTVQITVRNVNFSSGSGLDKPRSGNVYVVVYVSVQNMGPGTIHSLYTSDFQVKDANGVVRNEDYIYSLARDCNLPLVDLAAGGKLEGCITFEVPSTGKLEFIYAPYKYEGLKPGRYLSFIIRQ